MLYTKHKNYASNHVLCFLCQKHIFLFPIILCILLFLVTVVPVVLCILLFLVAVVTMIWAIQARWEETPYHRDDKGRRGGVINATLGADSVCGRNRLTPQFLCDVIDFSNCRNFSIQFFSKESSTTL